MIQLKNLFLATILFTCLTANAQARQEKELSLVEIEAAMKTDERLIVMQFSTDWCVYCKMQDRQLKKDKNIQRLLADRTYFIQLDAESKDTIIFHHVLYKPSCYENGLHELTLAFAEKHEQPSFPMWVILNKENEILFRQNGLVKPKRSNRSFT